MQESAEASGFDVPLFDYSVERASEYDAWIQAQPKRAYDEDYAKACLTSPAK